MDLAVCGTCGVQYSETSMKSCKICDDPRQYVAPAGQWWTSLGALQESKKYHNEFHPVKDDPSLLSIVTVPQFGIGQRALLCRTTAGNVLWDCITYIDDDTVRHIKEDLGGIKAIAISHPHYYSTAIQWAEAFDCPVYYSAEDEEWIMRWSGYVESIDRTVSDLEGAKQVVWSSLELSLLGGAVTIVKTGGHFPGSSVLLWKEKKKLLVADTIYPVPSGVYHVDRRPGTTSFSFMRSYPNLIPLPPDDVHRIWKAVAPLDFEDTHGAFMRGDTYGDSKKRMLESVKIYVKAMGYMDHPALQESL